MLILLATAASVFAHSSSESYLTLRVQDQTLAGEWRMALRDLEDAVGLDANDDGAITWDELRSRRAEISHYASSHLEIVKGEVQARVRITELLVDHVSDGACAVLRFKASTGSGRALQVRYTPFFDMDWTHRGLLRLEHEEKVRLIVFNRTSQAIGIDLAQLQRDPGFPGFVQEGIWHIWTGYDHVLFLLTLLASGALISVRSVRDTYTQIFKIVTAFSAAHSVTLGLAALELIRVRSSLVEPVILASVALAPLHRLVPGLARRAWIVAGGFGLVHGLGFANSLTQLQLHGGDLVMPLLGFNLGVELGQLAIVITVMPMAMWVRRQWGKRLDPFHNATRIERRIEVSGPSVGRLQGP